MKDEQEQGYLGGGRAVPAGQGQSYVVQVQGKSYVGGVPAGHHGHQYAGGVPAGHHGHQYAGGEVVQSV